MRKLPMNGQELTRKVFKGKGIYEPVGLSEFFTIKELCTMLELGNFETNDRDWIYSAIDKLIVDKNI